MAIPDSALQRFDRFIGTWTLRPGGLFIKSVGEINVKGFVVQSLEMIAYDAQRRTFPSHVYSNMSGAVLSYEWDIQGNTVIHSGLGSTYRGVFTEAGRKLTGAWQPDKGVQATDGNAYDAVMIRQE